MHYTTEMSASLNRKMESSSATEMINETFTTFLVEDNRYDNSQHLFQGSWSPPSLYSVCSHGVVWHRWSPEEDKWPAINFSSRKCCVCCCPLTDSTRLPRLDKQTWQWNRQTVVPLDECSTQLICRFNIYSGSSHFWRLLTPFVRPS